MNKLLLTAVSFGIATSAVAQQGNSLSAKDYEHAESFMTYRTEQLVDHNLVSPNWLVLTGYQATCSGTRS